MLYSEKVMDHFKNPRNIGEIKNPSGVGEVGNPICGDIMRMYLKIENDIIVDAKFMTFGCGSAIASSSMTTELIINKPVSEALKLSNKAVAEALDGLPPIKMHCSVLAEQAVRNALLDYAHKNSLVIPGLTDEEFDYQQLHNEVHGPSLTTKETKIKKSPRK